LFVQYPSVLILQESLFERVLRYLNYPLIEQGASFRVSLISLFLLILVICIAAVVSRFTRRVLKKRVLPRFRIEIGLQYTLLRLVHYLIISLGILYAVKIGFNVDLTSVAVIVGFLSVGIGFGLQYVASDIASGFILLFERPVRIGDWIALDGGIEGRVKNISLRSTMILTNENMAVILPNSKLAQNKFVNFSYGDRRVRLNIPVGVSYTSDLKSASEALLEAAQSVDEVLTEPAPQVHFDAFGESALKLQIRVWIDEPRDQAIIRSRVNFAIERAFRQRGIEIPFPQRDLHIRSSSIGIDEVRKAMDTKAEGSMQKAGGGQ
jgi:potassium-dependent mechanosensitive channel